MQVSLASRLEHDGTFGGVLRAGGAAFDLVRLMEDARLPDWDRRTETPIDALLRSGRFEAIVADLCARASSATTLPEAAASKMGPPVVRPGKILALGRTYREHAVELGNAPPAEPLVFDKLADTIAGTGATVTAPAYGGGRLDYEAELALVVGTRAWRLPSGNGAAAIGGILIANDLTLRGVQKAAQKAGHPWLMAKSFPGSCALGPFLGLPGPDCDLSALEISCRVNGAVRQQAWTRSLMRPPGALVEWLSQWIPLNPGDIVLTGTPAGTGPLVPGDECDITITGEDLDLGRLVTRVA